MKLSDIRDPDLLTAGVEQDGITLTVGSIESSAYNDYVRALWLRNSMREDKPSETESAQADRIGAAKLVRGWNLEDECSVENIADLFRRKPSIMNKVYAKANELGKPEKPELTNSGNGAKDVSGSGEKSAKSQR